MFDDSQYLLISLARSFKYFRHVELLYPSDNFQTLWIFNMFSCSKSIPWYLWTIRIWRIEFELVEDLKCLKLFWCFCCYSASTKTSFGFCSCSELLQLKFDEQTLQGNANCSAQKTGIGVIKVANERYLPYLQLCGKAFFCECHVLQV